MIAPHHTAAEYAAMRLPALPADKSAFIRRASREAWPRRKRQGRGGGWEYPVTALPAAAQAAYLMRQTRAVPAPTNDTPPADSAALWRHFAAKPDSIKQKAAARLGIVRAVKALAARGLSQRRAVATVAGESGESARTIYSWLAMVSAHDPADWLPALAPRYVGRTATADCSPEAWDAFKADYLRGDRPALRACYLRLQRLAPERGWTVPSERALRDRLRRELNPVAIRISRDGIDAAKQLYPAQERDHAVFHALQAVNADGHKFDVFVRWPDGSIGRPILLAWQDIYSGKILAWRIGKVESADLVRLAFCDLARSHGLPDVAYFDNGRGFASKWLTGGAPRRFRFKIRPEDPVGILTQLQVAVHWTQPYSGQSKPIERAFRDLAEMVAKHPAFAGAYTGARPDQKPANYGSRAVPLADFLTVLGREMAAHNAREGRRSSVCAGQSFDQVFAASYAAAPVRKATAEQLDLLLLAAEGVSCDRQTGEIGLFQNRYWAPELVPFCGRKVVARFDPERLAEPVRVYTLDGRFIAAAALWEKAGFDDVAQAKEHARARRQFLRAAKAQLDAERRMSAAQVASMLADVTPPDAPAPQTKVVRPVFTAAPRKTAAELQDEFHQMLNAGLRNIRRPGT